MGLSQKSQNPFPKLKKYDSIKGMKEQIFKPYLQNQPMLLPPNLDEMIPPGHIVRVVNNITDVINIQPLIKQYKGGGTSAYHPVMMLKVIVYAYTQRIFSSRQIAKALRENIYFMWLSGMNRPDHRTINRFRGEIMKAVIEEVFYQVVEQLLDLGYIDYEKYFVDGTKVEANANRYTYVWRKNTERYKAGLKKKIIELLDEIKDIEAAEEATYGENDLEEMGEGKEINAEELKEVAERINEKLNQDPKNRQLKKVKRLLEKEFIPRQEKYEEQEKLLNGRNSYSKTDPDATFMRTKDDHLGDGQLKPSYNVQIGTENQFVVGYSIHQHAADTSCFIEHMERVRHYMGEYPETVGTDAGYGSEESYAFLKNKKVVPFVKYNTFDLEDNENYKPKKKKKKKLYQQKDFTYIPDEDQFECPQGKRLVYKFTKEKTTDNGYVTSRRVYGGTECDQCTAKAACTKSKYQRELWISFELLKMKEEARGYLLSPLGKQMRSQRSTDVETVFGRIKHNWGFRRFMLRGLEKVSTEWGIMCIAHNMAKIAAQ